MTTKITNIKLKIFDAHYYSKEPEIRKRLTEFQRPRTEQFLWKELIYCLFAANSSAKMAEVAVTLLGPVHNNASLEKLQATVHKKVRFYNIRSRFFHENKLFVKSSHGSLLKMLNSFTNVHDLRTYLADEFLGMQFKEASHYLRNIGFTGLCIVDKHVLALMQEFGILKSAKPPKNRLEYLAIEKEIIAFAKKHKYDVDVLDLALWSYKSGYVGK